MKEEYSVTGIVHEKTVTGEITFTEVE